MTSLWHNGTIHIRRKASNDEVKHVRHQIIRQARVLWACMAIGIAMTSTLAATPINAYASTSSDIATQTRELQQLQSNLDAAKADAEKARQAVSDNASAIQQTQDKLSSLQERISDETSGTYKRRDDMSQITSILDANTLSDLIKGLANANHVSGMLTSDIAEQQRIKAALQRKSQDLSKEADAAQSKVDSLNTQVKEVNAKVTSLKSKLATEQASAAKSAAESTISSASASASTASTFATDMSNGDWKTGRTSAYGESSDPGSGTTTANGSKVSDWSMGVAIPLAWGRRDLLGHQIEISYNGKSVIATINDLGGMGGGSRALDLQPGVFKALGGVSTCNGWGLRTVSYRIL